VVRNLQPPWNVEAVVAAVVLDWERLGPIVGDSKERVVVKNAIDNGHFALSRIHYFSKLSCSLLHYFYRTGQRPDIQLTTPKYGIQPQTCTRIMQGTGMVNRGYGYC
jgi:hypothetical protein